MWPRRAHPSHQLGGRQAAQNDPPVRFARKNAHSNKPFRMISLRQTRSQLPWIDIFTKNPRGWGMYLPATPLIVGLSAAPVNSNPPRSPADSALIAPETAKHISVERTNPEVTDKIDAEGKQVKLRAKVTAGTGYRVEARAPTRPDVNRAPMLTREDRHRLHSMGCADYTDLTRFLENDALPREPGW